MKQLNEQQVNNADIKAILNKAAGSREKPGIVGRLLRKDKIDVADLQKSWQEQGYPDDTRDIKALLLSHGFSEREIKKVFSEVFGTYDTGKSQEPDVPGQSPTLLKIVQYAKKNNLTQDLIQFMQQEFGFKESVSHQGKIVVEDIRRIFTAIVQEERSGRAELIKQEDKIKLGRTRK